MAAHAVALGLGPREAEVASAPPPEPGRMRRPVVIGLYVVFLVLLAEAFGQIAVRVLTGRWPLTDGGGQNADMFEAHPYLVGAPRPGAAVQRGAVRISINRLGYRGPEITPLPDPGVLRVLALGGSTTFGNYV